MQGSRGLEGAGVGRQCWAGSVVELYRLRRLKMSLLAVPYSKESEAPGLMQEVESAYMRRKTVVKDGSCRVTGVRLGPRGLIGAVPVEKHDGPVVERHSRTPTAMKGEHYRRRHWHSRSRPGQPQHGHLTGLGPSLVWYQPSEEFVRGILPPKIQVARSQWGGIGHGCDYKCEDRWTGPLAGPSLPDLDFI